MGFDTKAGIELLPYVPVKEVMIVITGKNMDIGVSFSGFGLII